MYGNWKSRVKWVLAVLVLVAASIWPTFFASCSIVRMLNSPAKSTPKTDPSPPLVDAAP